jgi:hypothetical protein
VAVNRIARWNGSTWSALGAGMDGSVYVLKTLPNGDLVAGGSFTTAGGVPAPFVAGWNGTNWSALGTGMDNYVSALATLPNGALVAGGYFTTAGGVAANKIAQWNGTSWSAMGAGLSYSNPTALATLPNGDIVAGGGFLTAGVPAGYMVRWNGVSWSSLGAAMNGYVSALTTLPNGDLVAGGGFTTAGGVVSANVARLTTTCPAAAIVSGTGCPSSGGSNTLTATSLPWIGGTFRAKGTGLPNLAIVVGVLSVTPVPQGTSPLNAIFAQGAPGCDVLVAQDVLQAIVTTTGTATLAQPVPNSPAIIGARFYAQMVPIAIDPMVNILSVTSTNALQLTIGSF